MCQFANCRDHARPVSIMLSSVRLSLAGTKLCVLGGHTPAEAAPLCGVECYDLLSATWTDAVESLPMSLTAPKAVILRY